MDGRRLSVTFTADDRVVHTDEMIGGVKDARLWAKAGLERWGADGYLIYETDSGRVLDVVP